MLNIQGIKFRTSRDISTSFEIQFTACMDISTFWGESLLTVRLLFSVLENELCSFSIRNKDIVVNINKLSLK